MLPDEQGLWPLRLLRRSLFLALVRGATAACMAQRTEDTAAENGGVRAGGAECDAVCGAVCAARCVRRGECGAVSEWRTAAARKGGAVRGLPVGSGTDSRNKGAQAS